MMKNSFLDMTAEILRSKLLDLLVNYVRKCARVVCQSVSRIEGKMIKEKYRRRERRRQEEARGRREEVCGGKFG